MKTITAVILLFVAVNVCGQSNEDRIAAAGWTAQHDPACSVIGTTGDPPMTPFYWEVGDSSGLLASGSIGTGAPDATSPMSIASASKWIYAAYVAQKFSGALSAYDIRFLTMSSGYTGMNTNECNPATSTGPQTVNQCLAKGTNAAYYSSQDGYWVYNSGHFENHAVHAGVRRSGQHDRSGGRQRGRSLCRDI